MENALIDLSTQLIKKLNVRIMCLAKMNKRCEYEGSISTTVGGDTFSKFYEK